MTLRQLAGGAVLAALLAGCAGVPDSGPLHLGRPVAAAGGGLADAIVREVPAGPQPHESRVALVTGFLRAMIDSGDGYGVARAYLAPGTSWSPGPGITVYADPVRISARGSSDVVLRARRVGVIGPRGAYRVEPGRVVERLELTRRSGEWRISRLPPGVMLSVGDAERLLQPASVYFLTPDGRTVVPEPVLEPPQQPGLATTLMRALVSGPGQSVADGVRTAVPRGTSLLGNVPISPEGVAEVDLSSNARQLSSAQLTRLSAQVVWTLRQLNAVTGVRLLVNGDALTGPGVPALQSVHAWPQFNPAAAPASSGSLVLRSGRVIGFGTDVPRSLRIAGLSWVARSADGARVAAVRGGSGTGELLTGAAPAASLAVRLRAKGLTAPSFAPDGRVFVAAGQALYVVPPSGGSHLVGLPDDLAGRVIRSVAVSRDGTRAALVVGRGELAIASLAGSGSHVSLSAPRMVIPAAARASGAAWSDAGQVVTTVRRDRGRDVVTVGLDGYQVQSRSAPGMPADLNEVAASPGQRILASNPEGTWQLTGDQWSRLSRGTRPSYAGG